MPLDPIHTIRAAKKLHLKDGIFVSLCPPRVMQGHLRAHNGRVHSMGPATTVERGEEVLECWRQVIMTALPLAGVNPNRVVLRHFPRSKHPEIIDRLHTIDEAGHTNIARQCFIECAQNGIMNIAVDITGPPSQVVGVLAAAGESGLRCVFSELQVSRSLRTDGRQIDPRAPIHIIGGEEALPHVTLTDVVSGRPLPARGLLSLRDGSAPDGFALLRAVERRAGGLGFQYLEDTFAVFTKASGLRAGDFVKNALFDAVFLDYEAPGRLDDATIRSYILDAFSNAQVEAAVVEMQPVARRHEILTLDRAAVAAAVAEIITKIAGSMK